MKWVWENGNSLSLDPRRLAVVGDSVEGNMATVVTMLAKPLGGPAIIINYGRVWCPKWWKKRYAHKLVNARVTVITCRYHGTIDDFVKLNDISKTRAARGALEQASSKLWRIRWNEEK